MPFFREKPLPAPTLFDLEEPIDPSIPAPDVPVWVSVVVKALFWVLAIVFFPVTLLLIWGYRSGRITWGVGGVFVDPDDFPLEDFPEAGSDG